MCQYMSTDGKASDWHQMHLGHLALSGASIVCTEATAVLPEGRITPGDLGLWDDATEEALKPVLATIRRYSKVATVAQLAHAGRKASSHLPWHGAELIPVSEGGWVPHAPSAVPWKDGEPAPLALDAAGLDHVREAFASSARRAARLGFDGIEVHAAHGYLLHEFLSPLANHRTDAYGGSLANRMRFPIEVFEAVRAAFPSDKPVGMRVSATDWTEGGWDVEHTIALAKELKARHIDWIDVSSGGISPRQKIPVGPGYQVPLAHAVKEATGVNTWAVGLITEARQAEQIIADGKADFIALARAMLYDPRWAWHAAAELGATVDAPPSYWRSAPRQHSAIFRNASNSAR